MDDFLVYEASSHTLIAKPQFDLSMFGKSISGTLIGSPVDSVEIYIAQISISYVSDGPQFVELTDSQKITIQPITCSNADADWSFDLPQVVAAEQQSIGIELLHNTEVSEMFVLQGLTVTIIPRF